MELFLKRSRRHGNTVALLLPLYLSSSDCLLKWSRRPSPLGVMGRGGIVCLQSFTLWCQALAATQSSRLYIPTWGVLPEILFYVELKPSWLTTIKDPEECEAFNHCDQIFDTGRRAMQSKSNINFAITQMSEYKKIDRSKCYKRFPTAAAAFGQRLTKWPPTNRQIWPQSVNQRSLVSVHGSINIRKLDTHTCARGHVDVVEYKYKARHLIPQGLKPYLHIATLGINSSIELEVNVWMVAMPDTRADPPFSIHQALFYLHVGPNEIRIHSRTYVC